MPLSWLSGLPGKILAWGAAIGAAVAAALLYGQRKRAEGRADEKGKQDAAAAKQNSDMLHAPRVRDRDDLAGRLRDGKF